MQITGRVTLHFGYLEIWKWIVQRQHIISHMGWFLKKHDSRATLASGLALPGMWWFCGEKKKNNTQNQSPLSFTLEWWSNKFKQFFKQGLISELRIIVQWFIISSVFPMLCWIYTRRFGKRTEPETVPCRRIPLRSKGNSYW